jgi:hypothetical protein
MAHASTLFVGLDVHKETIAGAYVVGRGCGDHLCAGGSIPGLARVLRHCLDTIHTLATGQYITQCSMLALSCDQLSKRYGAKTKERVCLNEPGSASADCPRGRDRVPSVRQMS